MLVLITFLFDTIYIFFSQPPPARTDKLSPSLVGQKIFIASIARNSEYMLRLYWSAALLSLCNFLGPQNVYVSIVESGSQDDTKGALRDLKAELKKLGVENRIIVGEDVTQQMEDLVTTPEEGKRQGWIYTGNGTEGWEKRRIPHLASLRNKAMEPLVENSDERKWDRLLWINDVIFTVRIVRFLRRGSGHGIASPFLRYFSFPFAQCLSNYRMKMLQRFSRLGTVIMQLFALSTFQQMRITTMIPSLSGTLLVTKLFQQHTPFSTHRLH
jgi:Cryptococcal mannosyltransferase 1